MILIACKKTGWGIIILLLLALHVEIMLYIELMKL